MSSILWHPDFSASKLQFIPVIVTGYFSDITTVSCQTVTISFVHFWRERGGSVLSKKHFQMKELGGITEGNTNSLLHTDNMALSLKVITTHILHGINLRKLENAHLLITFKENTFCAMQFFSKQMICEVFLHCHQYKWYFCVGTKVDTFFECILFFYLMSELFHPVHLKPRHSKIKTDFLH